MRAHRFLAVLAGDTVVRVGHRLDRLVVDIETELDALMVELLRLRRRVDVLQTETQSKTEEAADEQAQTKRQGQR